MKCRANPGAWRESASANVYGLALSFGPLQWGYRGHVKTFTFLLSQLKQRSRFLNTNGAEMPIQREAGCERHTFACVSCYVRVGWVKFYL